MKILITGAAGFLGSHLADYFVEKGHYVVGIDDFSGGIAMNIHPDVNFITADITKHDFCWLFKDVEVVYHCAAAPYEGVSVFSPGYICNNIFGGSVNVFSGAIQAGVRRIINCSSMARYGTNKTPFKESYKPKPQDPYGIAKEAAERVLENLSEVHGIEYVTAVPHNIYGPKQYYFDPYRNVASIFLNAMQQGIRPIIYGDGNQLRSFSYISDCVGPLAEMATSLKVVGETINIGPDGDEISINCLYRLCSNITGFKEEPIYMPDRPKEVKIAHCSADKARKLLGYEAKVGLGEGMLQLNSWIAKQGPLPFNYNKLRIEIVNEKTPKNWTDRMLQK